MPRKSSTVGLFVLSIFVVSVVAIPSVFALSNGENATAAAGQPNLTTGGCDGSTQPVPSQTDLCFPYGAAIDSEGNLWVADTSNARVVQFPVVGGLPQSTESSLVGQTSYTGFSNNQGGSPSSSTVAAPWGVAFDSHGNLWVADTENNRVLEFPLVSGVISTTATEVIGQTSFSGFGCNQFTFSSDTTLCEPTGLAFDSLGNLWVADSDNSRVLEFPLVSGVISTTANVLIGQTSYAAGSASQACNQAGAGNPPAPPTASALCFPTALAFDSSGNLWVADNSNSRVIEFPLVSGAISTAATEVIGQTGFTSDSCNQGASTPTASTLCAPYGVAFDLGGNLWVTDTSNNRVLEFPLVSGAISTTSTTVLGQSTFSGHDTNAGAFPAPVAYGMSQPKSLVFDSTGNLWVVDYSNGRVLEFAAPALASTTTTVGCSPSSVGVGVDTTCTATVTGSSPTGAVTFSTSSITGAFSPSPTCSLSSGSCSVSFSDSTTGTDTVTAKYGGDGANAASSGSTGVSITGSLASTTTSVSCVASTIPVGVSSSCKVSVTGSSPTGTVTMASSLSGSFSGACILSGSGTTTCSVGYTPGPGSEGTNTITATYPGDTANSGSLGMTTVTATTRTAHVSLSCKPSKTPVVTGSLCTVTVTDTSPGTPITPTGTVDLKTVLGSGTFSGACVLSGSGATASCAVSFKPSKIGLYLIKANYAGDTDHTGDTALALLIAT